MSALTSRRNAPDLRLVLGIVLVVGSVAGVFAIVAAADRRVTVYAAASTLTPGDRIDRGDLVERTVALDGADDLYLGRGDIPNDGLVVTQSVAKGELLPTSAVGSTAGVRSTSIVLQLATRVSTAVVPGASVDLWSAPKAEEALAPTVLVGGATVTKVLDGSGNFAVDSKGSQVEVLVPRTNVARVLQAIADGDALVLLPAGIPVAGSPEAGPGS